MTVTGERVILPDLGWGIQGCFCVLEDFLPIFGFEPFLGNLEDNPNLLENRRGA
jgi:hypothetical protein